MEGWRKGEGGRGWQVERGAGRAAGRRGGRVKCEKEGGGKGWEGQVVMNIQINDISLSLSLSH